MEDKRTELSRESVMCFIAEYLKNVEEKAKWGAVTITFQNGKCKAIKKEETVTCKVL